METLGIAPPEKRDSSPLKGRLMLQFPDLGKAIAHRKRRCAEKLLENRPDFPYAKERRYRILSDVELSIFRPRQIQQE